MRGVKRLLKTVTMKEKARGEWALMCQLLLKLTCSVCKGGEYLEELLKLVQVLFFLEVKKILLIKSFWDYLLKSNSELLVSNGMFYFYPLDPNFKIL